jgi:hypothetical protein
MCKIYVDPATSEPQPPSLPVSTDESVTQVTPPTAIQGDPPTLDWVLLAI